MDKILKQLISVDRKLKENKQWYDQINNGQHYNIYPKDKSKDLDNCKVEKRILLNRKQYLLDSLTIAVNLAKCDLNTELREMNNNKKIDNE